MHFEAADTFLELIQFLVITVGIAVNGFIAIVNVIWWLKQRNVKTVDLIILNLGVTRLLFLCTSPILDSPLYTDALLHNMEYILAIFLCTFECIIDYSLWVGTLLCIFYCVKITNYKHRFFIYLKRNIPRLVPAFLIVSLVISFVCSLPLGWLVYDLETINSTNASGEFFEQRLILNYNNLLIIYIFRSASPFFLFCSAFCLLIGSLWSHSRHMKSMSCGFRPPKLDAHIRIVKSMLSFIFLYLICFVSSTLYPSSLRSQNKLWLMLCNLGVFIYPSLHSIVLIWSHRRLNCLVCSVVHLAIGKKSNGS